MRAVDLHACSLECRHELKKQAPAGDRRTKTTTTATNVCDGHARSRDQAKFGRLNNGNAERWTQDQ
eukprot:4800492-Pleurochrysis_carterae.AAC.1